MQNNASYFKLFLYISPTQRAPKRKAASNNNNNKGKKNTAVTAALLSASAIDVAFGQHLNMIARHGVYWDNMEISAFAWECDFKIYQRDFAYVVTGGKGGGGGGVEGQRKNVLHIAYYVSFV